MHILSTLTVGLVLVSAPRAFARVDLCGEHLAGVAELLAPGLTYREEILSNVNVPEVSRAMRVQRAHVKERGAAPLLDQALRNRVERLNDADAAAQFLFGLDTLAALEPALYAATLNLAIEARSSAHARALPALVQRGALIFVGEKFSLAQRLTFLKTLLAHPAASAEFIKIANAGQWIVAALTSPGLTDLLGPRDISSICTFAQALAEREIALIQGGAVDPRLGREQWLLARDLTRTAQGLLGPGPSSCRAQLAQTAAAITSLGRDHQFTP